MGERETFVFLNVPLKNNLEVISFFFAVVQTITHVLYTTEQAFQFQNKNVKV